MLDKTYRPQAVEQRLYAEWESSGAFKAGQRPNAKPFSIVIPPPNVTGSLHIGHALNNTLQDVLCRFERMRGRDVLWQPGTDHAGISTQLVVERQLAERQTSRQAMGREAFIKRVWEWKEESGGTIVRQLKRLGASCDWSRERFTMDEGLSQAVLRVFVQLYKEGLIYKDKRLVNWDPRLETAVSDLEVESIEVKGNLWHLKYPLVDNPEHFIVVATTRPETMLGDTAVAVHPDDERYKPMIGKMIAHPLTGRKIPIVADEHSDPEKGSGAVKITPAHDFNDFEVGKRHKLEQIALLDTRGRLNDSVPAAYRGMDRFEARKKIVADLEALGLLEKIEPITHAVPHDEKTKTVVLEPMLTEQWYCNAQVLAQAAMASVRSGETKFVPEHWEKTYFQWLENIQPWCISRQLWWGHQIPAWYGPDGHIFVEESEAEAQSAAERHYGEAAKLTRDEDVLDTWFSSALWPFSTQGWPENTPALGRYYPTDVVVTMFDIIFFWVARMMMMGTHFLKKAPFHTILIHARVVDEKGQKMSKTKGNVVDPLVLIDEFGADALRFAVAIAAAQGKDVRMGPARVESYRNFCTKLWNAARFCEMNGAVRTAGFDPKRVEERVNLWIVGEVEKTAKAVTQAIEAYRFNEAAGALYRFVWDVYCDWYLEFIKPVLMEGSDAAKAETRATAAWVLDQILLLAHPFMPFITEELWQRTGEVGPKRESALILAEWPKYPALGNADASAEMDWVIKLITEVRSVRSSMNVPAGARIEMILKGANADSKARLVRHNDLILRLARLEKAEVGDAIPKGSAQIVLGEAVAALPLQGVIDMAVESTRLKKELAKTEGEISRIDAKLSNQQFVSKAPEEVIDEQREKRAEWESVRAKLAEALKILSSAA